MKSRSIDIAIIGGSGLYELEGLSNMESMEVDTPFGKPSDAIVTGQFDGANVAFLPRHGRGHRLNPTQIPVRANIYALKTLGATCLISVSAVGSLRDDFERLHLAIPDQLIDRTRQRNNTFFDEQLVVHAGFAEPFCPVIRRVILNSASDLNIPVHSDATMVVMEGPAFSTKAESHMYRSWGADIIGMTALPEAKLAREAELCYATMAWVTDYDCWHESEEVVTVEMVVQNLMKNVDNSKNMLKALIPNLVSDRDCACQSSLRDTIITSKEWIPEELKRKLSPLINKYI